MRILLIYPKMKFSYKKTPWLIMRFFPSLALDQIAGNTPSRHEVKIVDEERQKIKFNCDVDVVGISCVTPQAPRAYEIADGFRKRGVKVVIGGWHPSALPEEAKQHADSVVIGEAELTWPRLLKDLEKGELKPFYRNNEPVDLRNIKPAKRGLAGGVNIISAVQASRGCPMGCEFCGVSNSIYGKVFRMRPVEDVVEELRSIKQRRLWFYDPSLTINPRYTKELFRRMKELDKRFVAFGNIDVLSRDDELLRLAGEAGCQMWFIGLESLSQRVIDRLGKKSNRVENYASAIRKIHDYGIGVIGAFIFGFDEDTLEVFDYTKEMVYELAIDAAEFTILTPYPGTPLFYRLKREERIFTYDWSKYTQQGNVVFQPKNMTPDQLLNGTNRVIREVGSPSGFMKRAFNDKHFFIRNITQLLR
ncbi:MAG: B12-binding domain-containing radical SAM protein [Thermoplasmata archaeon]|nr:B12-binding domain-containing radical SAM protein [Thermoplasmata archaeon]RLF26825.1 MAG: B12-binding domain-containing radical SAM protein [Thermoplasmata archaeon]